jgi:gentisate 1,2-dioxygenase
VGYQAVSVTGMKKCRYFNYFLDILTVGIAEVVTRTLHNRIYSASKGSGGMRRGGSQPTSQLSIGDQTKN